MCYQCEIERIRRAEAERAAMYYRPMSFDFKIDLPKAEAPKPAPDNPTPQSIAEEVLRLGKDHKADLSVVTSAVKRAEDRRKDYVLEALHGVVALAKLKGFETPKRFVLAYWKNDETKTAQGVDFGYHLSVSGDDERKEYRVFLPGDVFGDVAGTKHYTMETMKKWFEDRGIQHVVAYLD